MQEKLLYQIKQFSAKGYIEDWENEILKTTANNNGIDKGILQSLIENELRKGNEGKAKSKNYKWLFAAIVSIVIIIIIYLGYGFYSKQGISPINKTTSIDSIIENKKDNQGVNSSSKKDSGTEPIVSNNSLKESKHEDTNNETKSESKLQTNKIESNSIVIRTDQFCDNANSYKGKTITVIGVSYNKTDNYYKDDEGRKDFRGLQFDNGDWSLGIQVKEFNFGCDGTVPLYVTQNVGWGKFPNIGYGLLDITIHYNNVEGGWMITSIKRH